MFKKNAFERMFIELDDSDKQFFITKWDDQGIRKGARVNVDADYVAVFIDRGTVVGVLQPGKHVLETGPNPVTGLIVNAITEGGLYDMELFFVSTRERTSTPFGGPIDNIQSQDFIVSLRVFGEFAYKIVNPVALITKIAGTGESSATIDKKIENWTTNQVLAAIREEVPTLLTKNGVLNIGATQDEAEEKTLDKANRTLVEYGINITNFGQLVLNADEQDLKLLKDYVMRKKFVEMAGGYEQYTRGEALMAAGKQTHTSGETGSINMLLLSSLMGQKGLGVPATNTPNVVEQPTKSEAEHTCRNCSKNINDKYAFCPTCGVSQKCSQCSAQLPKGIFCPECGHENKIS